MLAGKAGGGQKVDRFNKPASSGDMNATERYLREQLVSLDAGTYMAPHKLTVATY
jgi:hypothetical protein